MNAGAAQTYDEQRAKAFVGRMAGILNDAGLALMISVGHRTGLFDTLVRSGAVTSEELAADAGLNERYVREWLGAMTVGRIVELEPNEGRYSLPEEHAAYLTRAASPDNIAVTTQYISVLGSVEDDIVRCFKDGGGVPYEHFERFHDVMAEESAQTTISALVDAILPLVPELTARLEQGIRGADLGCGRGLALAELATRFPESTFVGLDLSSDAIASARANAETLGLENVSYEVRDLTTFDKDAEPDSFDLVTTFDAVHDQASPISLLKGIHRSLAPDGVYLMQDIDGHSHHHANLEMTLAPFMYTISCMHCMTVSLAQGGEGLGAMWGVEKAEELFREAGFSSFEAKRLDHDPINVYVVARP